MKACVHVNGELLEETDVQNHLRQGCTIVPTLFITFIPVLLWSAGVSEWQAWMELQIHAVQVGIITWYTSKGVSKATNIKEVDATVDAGNRGCSSEDLSTAIQENYRWLLW